MADTFEDLKHVLRYRSWDDERFYKALRRLYFANVATFLCQYHDDTPLPSDELSSVDPFIELTGKSDPRRSLVESAHEFLSAWSTLKYNLVTNDGEHYEATDSFRFMEELALAFSAEVLEHEASAA